MANAPTPPRGPVLALIGLHKTYRLGQHTVPALQGVDLSVQAGELLALTGPSGSGKSTVLNIAGLIDQADAGEVWLDGQSVGGLDAEAATRLRRDAIGFIFQGFNLVPVMTVAENVDYPLFLDRCAAGRAQAACGRGAAASVGLQDHAQHRPDALLGWAAPAGGDCPRAGQAPEAS